jgi:hypothetical protein
MSTAKIMKFRALFILPLLALTGCQLLGITKPLSFDESLATAYVSQTAVLNAATTAVSAHTITSAQGQHVLTMAHSSRALLDEAKTLENSGNVTAAGTELTLAATALTALQQFLNKQTTGAK